MSSVWTIVSKVFQSKTLIVGWLTFAVGIISYLGNDAWIAQYPGFVAALLASLGILQNVLRWLTVLPLSDK